MFKRLYLFRHGLAVKPGEEYGDAVLTAQLLPEAVPVIERLGVYLQAIPSSFRYVSPVLRCQQTAQLVATQTGQDFVVDKRLREYNQESFSDLHSRVQSFVDDLLKLPADTENIWVCTHGGVMGGIKNLLLKNKFEAGDELDYPFPGSLCIFEGSALKTLDFNFQPPKELNETFPLISEMITHKGSV